MPPRRKRPRISAAQSLLDDDALSPRKRPTLEEPPLDYPYSRTLAGHHGCVNALACSPKDGRWLASGGDDRRILLWDTFSDLTELQPKTAFTGPRANIFSCDFSADAKSVFAGGLCSDAFQWDVGAEGGLSTPVRRYEDHDASIRGLSCHPTDPSLFITASEDGTLLRHDARAGRGDSRPMLSARTEFVDVLWSPASEHLFATAEMKEIYLHDRRKASINHDPSECAVVTYVSSLARGSTVRLATPDISSLAFDPSGTILASMASRWYPTIYSVNDEFPLAVLTSHDGGQLSFSDCATVKHGGFSHPKDGQPLHFAAGSEDGFLTHVWRIPSLDAMRSQRGRQPFAEWVTDREGKHEVAFTETDVGDRVTPLQVTSPTTRLYGHRSIPNTALFHPTLPILFTAGVEKIVKLHGRHPIGSAEASRTGKQIRERYLGPEGGQRPEILGFGNFADDSDDTGDDSDSEDDLEGGIGTRLPRRMRPGRQRTEEERRQEDVRTLLMFDELLREEVRGYERLWDDIPQWWSGDGNGYGWLNTTPVIESYSEDEEDEQDDLS